MLVKKTVVTEDTLLPMMFFSSGDGGGGGGKRVDGKTVLFSLKLLTVANRRHEAPVADTKCF